MPLRMSALPPHWPMQAANSSSRWRRMQIAAKDYVALPSDERAKAFEAAQTLTTKNFDKISAAANGMLPQDIGGQIRQRLGELRLNFDYLVEEQRALGYSDSQGTRKRLDEAAAQVEQLISDGMQVLSEAERDWLMLSLLTMRRYEAQYRFDRNPATWELFFKAYRSFEEKLSALLVDDQVKAKLGDLVKDYSSTLAQWNRQSQNIQKSFPRSSRRASSSFRSRRRSSPWRGAQSCSLRGRLDAVAEPHPHLHHRGRLRPRS